MCTSPPPSSSAVTSSPVAAFTSGGPPRKIVPGPLHDDRLVAHRRDVGAAGGARPHHDRDLRDALRRQPRLVVEDAAEVLAIGKDLGLQRQEGAAGVDQVDARQPVVERHLLRPQVLLHRERIVGAALDRRVVGDDQDLAAGHAADAGDEAGAGRVAVVQARGGERRRFRGTATRDRAAASIRSRTGSLPCARWRACAAATAAARAASSRARRSATSAVMRAALSRNSALSGRAWLSTTSMGPAIIGQASWRAGCPRHHPC